MTYMFILKCALKLVEEIILYYDVRSKKHHNTKNILWCTVIYYVLPFCYLEHLDSLRLGYAK